MVYIIFSKIIILAWSQNIHLDQSLHSQYPDVFVPKEKYSTSVMKIKIKITRV